MQLNTLMKYVSIFGAQFLGTQFSELVAQLVAAGIPQQAAAVIALLLIGVPLVAGAVGLHWQSSPKDVITR